MITENVEEGVERAIEIAQHVQRAGKAVRGPVRPRVLTHRGVVDASGFLFPLSILEEREAQRRIVRLWVPGASVLRVTDIWNTAYTTIHTDIYTNVHTNIDTEAPDDRQHPMLLLRLPTPLRVSCTFAPGLPLVAQAGLLTAMPLSGAEVKQLEAPTGTVVIARGGVAQVLALANASVEDPADWLDTSVWQWTQAASLGPPPAPIRDLATKPAFNARARLTNMTGEEPERQSVIEALRQAAQRGRNGSSETTAGTQQGGKLKKGSGASRAGSASLFDSLLKRLFGQKADSGSAAGQGQAANKPGRISLLDTVNRLAARLATLAGLSKLIGRRQAEYLKRMMDMFDRGNLDQALRHAIGFSDLEGMDAPPALRTPTPRVDLTISPQVTPTASGIGLPTEWMAQLHSLYRQAFERLERAGRIEEAAFVLAELLSEHEEVVNFLEKHRRFKLAAEIAEARNLPPGLVVRQWFLAGDSARAALIARRTGAFADAVLRLERANSVKSVDKNVDRPVSLRWLWAQSLAEAGNYYQAFMVARARAVDDLLMEEGHWEEIFGWLEKSVALGGSVGAEALAWQLNLLVAKKEAGAAGDAREQALLLLENEDAENAPSRAAFARELPKGTASRYVEPIARLAVRSCLRDASLGFKTELIETEYTRLLNLADDSALRADMPPRPKPAPASPLAPLVFTFPGEDAGTLPLSDAAFLPDGRCLVALREMGIRMVTRDGRSVMHWDTPAHQLIMSDIGNRALVLAQRGNLWRVARLDLATRKLQPLGTATLGAFAATYDGSLWFVAIDNDFLALDATAEDLAALWRLPTLEGKIKTITRSPKHCSFLLFAAGATDTWGRPTPLWTRLERWTHSLPDLLLRDRAEMKQMLDTPEGTGDERGTNGLADRQTFNRYAQSVAAEGDVYHLKVDGVKVDGVKVLTSDANLSSASSRDSTWFVSLVRLPAASSASEPDIPYSERILSSYASAGMMVVDEKWLWFTILTPEGVEGRLLTRPQGTLKARFQLRGVSRISARFTSTHLTLADDRGRLLVLELDSLQLIRNLRLS